jgi:hypothetical protein
VAAGNPPCRRPRSWCRIRRPVDSAIRWPAAAVAAVVAATAAVAVAVAAVAVDDARAGGAAVAAAAAAAADDDDDGDGDGAGAARRPLDSAGPGAGGSPEVRLGHPLHDRGAAVGPRPRPRRPRSPSTGPTVCSPRCFRPSLRTQQTFTPSVLLLLLLLLLTRLRHIFSEASLSDPGPLILIIFDRLCR